jgi:hypothetical protein
MYQHTEEVRCVRCRGQRWIPVPYIPLDSRGRVTGPAVDLRPYTCTRCRAVLAGRNVADPLGKEPSEAQLEVRRRFTEARQRPLVGVLDGGKPFSSALTTPDEAFSRPPAQSLVPRIDITRTRRGRPQKWVNRQAAVREAVRAHRARQTDLRSLGPKEGDAA